MLRDTYNWAAQFLLFLAPVVTSGWRCYSWARRRGWRWGACSRRSSGLESCSSSRLTVVTAAAARPPPPSHWVKDSPSGGPPRQHPALTAGDRQPGQAPLAAGRLLQAGSGRSAGRRWCGPDRPAVTSGSGGRGPGEAAATVEHCCASRYWESQGTGGHVCTPAWLCWLGLDGLDGGLQESWHMQPVVPWSWDCV